MLYANFYSHTQLDNDQSMIKRHCKFLPFIFTLNIIVLKNPR